MAQESQSFLLFESLKAHLRSRNLTYQDIAERLRLSEATIKRIFSLRDCDITRLAEICEAADTTLLELAASASRVAAKSFELAPEAVEFFVEHLEYFVFFRELSAGRKPSDVAVEAKLDARSLSRYLRKLEELDLLVRLPGGHVRMQVEGYLTLREGCPLQRKLVGAWAPLAVQRAVESSVDGTHWVRCFSTGLLPEHRTRLLHDLNEVVARYKQQGFLDQELSKSATTAVGGVLALVPFRVGQRLPIPRL